MLLFLAAVFALHCVAFTALGFGRREPRYFLLSGTFLFLGTLYGLKARGGGGSAAGVPWTILLRIGALSCTAAYLTITARRPGTWVYRLISRLRRR